ncbi:MAG: hypothetical protein O7A09_06055 [Proteobacteria bacterium]|nr:hypothetical protein [Pseudomonadota bacterium]
MTVTPVARVAGALALFLLLAGAPAVHASQPGERASEPGVSQSAEPVYPFWTQGPLAPKPEARMEALKKKAAKREAISARGRSRRALWQAAIVLCALALVAQRMASRRPSRRAGIARKVVLVALALASLTSYYGSELFARDPRKMHLKELYHYYIGGKYFAELGYGGIYECTLAVAAQQRFWWAAGLPHVRDLHTMQLRPTAEVAVRGVRVCPDRFSSERWQEFTRDIEWFDTYMGPYRWGRALGDHGFNPSPVWTFLATPLARFTAPESLWLLARIDILLVLASLGAVGWAFGLEALCLFAVAWGTGFLWDSRWIGYAFLREIWFAAAVIGVCCLRRGWDAVAGGVLALAALTRVFPAVFLAGYALHALREARRPRALSPRARRFAAGAIAATVVLIGGSLAIPGGGWNAYQGFQRNLSTFLGDVAPINRTGVQPLLWRVDGTSDQWRPSAARETDAFRIDPSWTGSLRLAAAVLALFLFWRGLGHAQPWEASAAAFALIPILAAPSHHYLRFVVLGMLLATRRPWIAVWLLLACLAWLAEGASMLRTDVHFTVVSAVAVALCFAVLGSMAVPGDRKGSSAAR